jgi:hypothetical protein
MEKLDEDTVKMIELRVPAVSKLDAGFVKEHMRTTALFKHTVDPVLRRNIEHEVLQLDYLIPSIFTLFKDLRFLEPVAKAIGALLPEPNDRKRTLRENLRFLYSDSTKDATAIEIQDSEMSFSKIAGTFDYTFDLAIRQLFLCAMRYFTDPSNISSKKNMNPIRQTINAPKRFLGFKLLNLSRRLGFQTLHLSEAVEDPTVRLLNDVLNTLPKEIFRFQGSPPVGLIEAFTEYLSSSTIVMDPNLAPNITSAGVGEPLSRRCGRACVTTSEDRMHLFLRTMHRQLGEYGSDGVDISSFFVKRCIYLAFFGSAQVLDGSMNGERNDVRDTIPVYTAHPDIGLESVRVPYNSESLLQESLLQESLLQESLLQESLLQESLLQEPSIPADRSMHNTEPMQLVPEVEQEQIPANPELEVDFVNVQGDVIARVGFTKELVSGAAKHYALNNNYSLMDELGKYYIWEECYDHLVDIEKKTIILVESTSSNQYRRG